MRKDVDIKLGKDLKVRLKIRDTITDLSKFKILKRAEYLSLPKLDMTLEEIENMDVVMKEQPELFVNME